VGPFVRHRRLARAASLRVAAVEELDLPGVDELLEGRVLRGSVGDLPGLARAETK